MPISPMKEAMLRALSYYKYLTVSHIVVLGISISKGKCRDYFRELRNDMKLTGRQVNYSISEKEKLQNKDDARRKRREDLHLLTIQGAKFLDSHTELCLPDIRFPKRPKKFLTNDYFHRVSTISIHISFEKRIQKNGLYGKKVMLYYWQNKESREKRFESDTRIKLKNGRHFTPDMILSYIQSSSQSFVFCLELYNGDKVKYATDQLRKLFWIIDSSRKVEQKVEANTIPRILCVCDNERLLKKIQERIRNDKFFRVKHIEKLLFFNLDNLVHNDFGKGWKNVKDEAFDLANLPQISL